MTRDDAKSWGTAAWARRVRDHALERQQGYPKCGRCGPHGWHGLVCGRNDCTCETSWEDVA